MPANRTGTYVTINADASGVPGSVIAWLSDPGGSFQRNRLTRASPIPLNTVLQPNTSYWVVVNDETSDTVGWGRTDGNAENSDSLPGWTIADGVVEKVGQGAWNSTVHPDSMLLAIHGYTNGNPDLTISGGSAYEGSAVPFTVTLEGALDREVTVEYEASDDTAIVGSDYTATSGTLTITAGSTSATIDIDTTEDNVEEDDETLIVTLSSPSSNADVGSPSSATGLIVDNDGQAELNVAAASAVEGETLAFAVTLGYPTEADVTVDYSTSIESGDTASADDFTAAAAETLTISAGDTTATIEIASVQDDKYESDETFTLTLSGPSSNAKLGTSAAAVGTIGNDEVPALIVSETSLDIDEGGTASFTVALANEPGATVTVSVSTGADSPLTFGDDELEFTASDWDTAQTVTVTAAHDNDIADATANVTISTSGSGYPALGMDIPVADELTTTSPEYCSPHLPCRFPSRAAQAIP